MTSLDSKLNTANRRFSFQGGGLAADTFAVVEMSGFEALSKPFNFEVILVSDNDAVNFDAMLSNQATLKIYASGETLETPYHGVLSEFEQLQQVDQLVFYKAVLVPRLGRVGLYRTSDVFLDDQKIPDVLDKVIKASGLTSSDYDKKTTGSYRSRAFVCQYQETNFDFISRWLEKEGMYYYFDHSRTNDKLVIVDDLIMLPAGVSNVTYRPVEDSTSGNASDSVHSFVCRQQPLPKQVILQGFNYAAAAVPLEQSYKVSDTGTGDVMLYGENFLTPEEGLRYARLRAQQILCNGKVFKGEASATGIRSGHFIQMSGHYRSDFDAKYLVTEIEHSGSQAGVLLAGIAHSFGGKSGETSYRHSFRAIPSDVQFRPECKTRRPHVVGTISAVVDAEGSGQYADMDELGQYKVQLPFSKSGKAANKGSARIRMATPYSGSGYGMHFPLHKGAEVLLSFIDGDPDQPVIVNAVYNSENKNPINKSDPALGMIQTAAGNSLTFDDTENQQSGTVYSPLGSSQWRVGQKFNDQTGIVVSAQKTWGDTRSGLHGRTQQDISLAAGNALVMAAGKGASVLTPQLAPQQGDVQVMGDYGLINIGEQPVITSTAATPQAGIPGTLDIYASHINMYAEPTGSAAGGNLKYGYIMKSGDPKQGAGTAWGWGDLYALQNFTTDYTASLATKAEGRVTVLGSSKTTYTQGHSNSATYGDSSSVTHGNNIKLVHGTDQSHTYGLSSSMFYGMKNDLTVGESNSVFIGAKTDTSASAKLTMALSAAVSLSIGAELKASLSATLEFAGGIKTGVSTVADVSAKTIAAKAAATELAATVTSLTTKTIALATESTALETSIFRLQLASVNIFT